MAAFSPASGTGTGRVLPHIGHGHGHERNEGIPQQFRFRVGVEVGRVAVVVDWAGAKLAMLSTFDLSTFDSP